MLVCWFDKIGVFAQNCIVKVIAQLDQSLQCLGHHKMCGRQNLLLFLIYALCDCYDTFERIVLCSHTPSCHHFCVAQQAGRGRFPR